MFKINFVTRIFAAMTAKLPGDRLYFVLTKNFFVPRPPSSWNHYFRIFPAMVKPWKTKKWRLILKPLSLRYSGETHVKRKISCRGWANWEQEQAMTSFGRQCQALAIILSFWVRLMAKRECFLNVHSMLCTNICSRFRCVASSRRLVASLADTGSSTVCRANTVWGSMFVGSGLHIRSVSSLLCILDGRHCDTKHGCGFCTLPARKCHWRLQSPSLLQSSLQNLKTQK